jgi:hypothetical protein
MPVSETVIKNKLNNRCCGHVNVLITPPQEQGILGKKWSKMAAIYAVKTVSIPKDAYNPCSWVCFLHKSKMTSISNGGIVQIRSLANQG